MSADELKLPPRLRDLFQLLRSRGASGCTSLEIARDLSIVSPGTASSELRKRLETAGLGTVSCERAGSTERGRLIYVYKIVDRGQGALFDALGEPARVPFEH